MMSSLRSSDRFFQKDGIWISFWRGWGLAARLRVLVGRRVLFERLALARLPLLRVVVFFLGLLRERELDLRLDELVLLLLRGTIIKG
jgi:hypothetical protein